MTARNRIGIFFVVLAIAGCAVSKDAVLSRSLAGVEAAEKSFHAYDLDHQGGIVDSATTREGAKRSAAEYRMQRDKVSAVIGLAYNAILVAAADGTDEKLKAMTEALAALLSAMRDFGAIPATTTTGAKP
jgi:hypothetical protein